LAPKKRVPKKRGKKKGKLRINPPKFRDTIEELYPKKFWPKTPK